MSGLVVRLNAATFPMSPRERAILSEAGLSVQEVEGATDGEVAAAVAEADAVMIISSYLRTASIAGMKRCRVISRVGTGVDKIDVEEATRRGIPVVNLPDFSTEEVADHTMALLLASARQLKAFESGMRAGKQPHDLPSMHRLSTRTLGLIGFGRIGRAVARRAAGFGMQILAVDPLLTAEAAAQAGVEAVGIDDALRRSDYLCLLCPLTPSTRGMITGEKLRAMKRDAVLVNTGRGELVNEQDLVQALRDGTLRYAALDVFAGINVFSPDGFPTDHPFFSLPNVLLTPHVAAYSEESAADSRERGARAVVEILAGIQPRHLVNTGVVPWYTTRKQ
jgi:D-3-phosphoglycerate dehydrogenase / 2-oxoglutarate reductase